jgi:hypothetical protein
MTPTEPAPEPLTIADRRALLEAHRDEVLERIAELQRDLAAVTDKITHYQTLEARR